MVLIRRCNGIRPALFSHSILPLPCDSYYEDGILFTNLSSFVIFTIYSPADDGVYDVFIPEMAEPGFYSIRVGRFGYQSLFDCSGQFELIQPAAPLAS